MNNRRQDDPAVDSRPTRREVLAYLAEASVWTAFNGGRVFAQAPAPERVNKLTARGGAIDVHHHHMPPALVGGSNRWSPALSLEQMDKFGIATSLVSLTQMGDILYDGTEKGRASVRLGNEYGATMMRDYPKRFGLLAALPLPDLEGCLAEINYSYDALKCDGIGIYSNDNGDRWPGDPYYEPMWQELNRRRAIVFIHPLAPKCCRTLNYGAAVSMNEFDFDVARAVTSLLVNGVLHRYPDVRIIITHSGGVVPVLSNRMQDRYPAEPKKREYIPNGVLPELKKIYYECAHATFPEPLAALTTLVGPTQILFGTDFSAERIETTVNELPTSGLSQDTLQVIERGNAERLFPRLKV
jgi:predicted TIM-barrel fold metal-dependent hydrolase